MDKKVVQLPDKELEAILKRYAESKEVRNKQSSNMIDDFFEIEEESITVKTDVETGELEITDDSDE